MKKYFVTGLVILLPVALTVAIVVFLVDLLTGPFVGAFETILYNQPWSDKLAGIPGAMRILHYIAQALILVLLFFSAVLLGMIGRWFFFRYLIAIGDALLHRIPLVNKVYKTSQDIIKTLFTSTANSFKQVVLVPFPTRDCFSLGLVSSEAPPQCKAAAKKDLISVFVATTPNPTSGYLLMYPREDCVFLEMKVEEAIKFIISCGVIHDGSIGAVPPPPTPQADVEPIA